MTAYYHYIGSSNLTPTAGGTVVLQANDTLMVGTGAAINVTAGTYGVAGNTGNQITLLGSVNSPNPTGVGIVIGTGATLTIGTTGAVNAADKGLELNNSGRVVSDGVINSTEYGVFLTGSLTMINSGTISARYGIFSHTSSATDHLYLTNTGTIATSLTSVEATAGGDRIINSGLIYRSPGITGVAGTAINLKSGDDLYDGRLGTINGNVRLGTGQDTAFGGAGSDIFFGDEDDDFLEGNGGDDTLDGGSGSNILSGGDGNDSLTAAGGNDVFDGGDGVDTVTLGGANLTIDLRSTAAQATGLGISHFISIENITGGGENDTLVGNGADNRFLSDGGNDTLDGGFGNDVLDGGADIDTARFAGSAAVTADLSIAGVQDTGHGLDTLIGIENLEGGAGHDMLAGDDTDNRLTGNAGHDTLRGRNGNDTLDGADGNDALIQEAGDGNDFLVGGAGIDTLVFSGTAGATVNLATAAAQNTGYGSDTLSGIENLTGGSGADTFVGSAFTNVLSGNAGADTLLGQAGNDLLYGGSENDTIYGGDHTDRLWGDVGNDNLSGDAGNDRLYGGTGRDVLSGGAGSDIFVFDTALNRSTNVDRITDFNVAADTIWLDNKYMTKLGAGTEARPGRLNAEFFVFDRAQEADDRLIYVKASGALLYDADGSGRGAAVQIALLSKNLTTLTAADFKII